MLPPSDCKVYTPSALAKAMVHALVPHPEDKWLDPCIGPGAFIVPLRERGIPKERIVGVDIDSTAGEEDLSATTLRGVDFFQWCSSVTQRFTKIVANPPYVAIRRLHPQLQGSLQSFRNETDSSFALRSNYWCAFLSASLGVLAHKGNLAFVLPAAWEYALYAADLRLKILQRFEEVEVHRCLEPLFPSVREGCVVLLAKGYLQTPRTCVRIEHRTPHDLIATLQKGVSRSTKSYRSTQAPDASLTSFMELYTVRIGCVTGNADYFLLTESDRIRLEGTYASGEQSSGTIVSALAMRLARYSASDTYYPQTLSILRLDKPRLTSADDEVSSTLFQILPRSRRPDATVSASDTIKTLTERLKVAEAMGDTAEYARLLARIGEVAMGKAQAPTFVDSGLLHSISRDLEKGIKESLAFRGTVTTVPAEEKARAEGGTSHLLAQEITGLKVSLGIDELLYVDDLPIITATYGYTRRNFEPTYEELGAKNLPVQIRSFPPVQKTAAQRLGRIDLIGTVPVLAREGEHEGIFMSLNSQRVIAWLDLNGVTLPDPQLPSIARILAALEPIDHDRYYDSIWQLRTRRMVYGLVHSLSHAAMRAITRYAGIDRTSVAEYIFLPLLGCVVYDSSSSFKLGGVATLVRDHLAAFLRNIADDSVECLYDPDCSDHTGACHGCLHSPEISCRVFNHGLSRAFLLGGHAPWADVSTETRIVGYWEMPVPL